MNFRKNKIYAEFAVSFPNHFHLQYHLHTVSVSSTLWYFFFFSADGSFSSLIRVDTVCCGILVPVLRAFIVKASHIGSLISIVHH